MDQHVARQDDEDGEGDEEGPRHRYYYSDKILGHLFRAVDEEKIWAEDIKIAIAAGASSFWEEFRNGINERVSSSIGLVEWEHRLAKADLIRHA